MPPKNNKSVSGYVQSKVSHLTPLASAPEDGCATDLGGHLNSAPDRLSCDDKGDNEGFFQPNAGKARIPAWICVLLTLVLLGSLVWFQNHSAAFDAQIYYPIASSYELGMLNPPPPDNPLVAKGKGLYLQVCVSCHQLDGQGVTGQNPPLVGTDWVLARSPNRLVHIVLNGLQGPVTVKGAEFNAVMAPWKDLLTDRQIAAVLTYIRQEWGNNRSDVTPEQVKNIREADSGREASWTVEELATLPDSE
jgi:mono/diheme cytochrome c family protein